MIINFPRTEIKSQKPAKLVSTDGRLVLTDGRLSYFGDLTTMLPRIRREFLSSELLVRAARIKKAEGPLTAIDATAGLGEDALLLAAAGFSVKMFERDPVIAALLEDSLRRALQVPELKAAARRMELVRADSIDELPKLKEPVDVVYLDPMFPARLKNSLTKKKFQLLKLLEAPCPDERTLFAAACTVRPRKLIIKRPLKGPPLAGHEPDYRVFGRTIRYDCFVFV